MDRKVSASDGRGRLHDPEPPTFRGSVTGPAIALAAAGLLGVAIAISACAAGTPARTGERSATAGRQAHPEPRTPAATTRGPLPASGDDRAAVVAAYLRFWQVAQHVDAHPQSQWAYLLAPVVAEPLLSRLTAALRARIQAGYRQFGDVRPRPALVELAAGHASVVDCQDASASGEIDTSTGLPTNIGQPRTPVAATLSRGADGRWRVSDARYLDGGC
jgi:hypothetical protein